MCSINYDFVVNSFLPDLDDLSESEPLKVFCERNNVDTQHAISATKTKSLDLEAAEMLRQPGRYTYIQ